MDDRIFQLLAEKTKDFPFSKVSGEPSPASGEETRLFRLKALVSHVRKMAVKKYCQTPESFHIFYTKDDWIQEAMIVFCNLCSDYKREKANFDNYARFIVSRRLIDIQRELFRKNPPVDDELRKISLSLKREKGRAPTIKELSDLTGRSEYEIEEFIKGGAGKRVFTREYEGMQEQKDAEIGMSAEEQYIRAAALKILMDCIDQLNPELKTLFTDHEFEGISFEKLYETPGISEILGGKSPSTFKRRYKENIYEPVRDCVRKQRTA